MPVETSWFVEGRVLLTRLCNEVTFTELIDANHRGTRMVASVDTPVYGLVDMSELRGFPNRIADVRAIAARGTGTNLAAIIFYGIQHPFLKFAARLFTHTLHADYWVVDTLQEAMTILEAQGCTFRLKRSV